jgi:hypothetical protein
MRRKYASGLVGTTCLVLGVGILALSAPPAAALSEPAAPTLAEGTGMGPKPDSDVRRLQRVLRAQGRSLGPAGIDGRFGPATAAAVRSLQSAFGLSADGVVGPKTRKLLRVLCRPGGCARPLKTAAGGSGGADAPLSGRRAATGDSGAGATSDVTWVIVSGLALLAIALACGWWRSHGREGRSEPISFPYPELRSAHLPGRRAIAYLGTGENRSRERAEAQEAAIEDECTHRGWLLVDSLREVAGGGREALAYALERIAAGHASCLVVCHLDSVGSSAAELGELLERLGEAAACFVALDAGVDTTTREGTLAATLLVAVTKRERERSVTINGNGQRGSYRRGGAP